MKLFRISGPPGDTSATKPNGIAITIPCRDEHFKAMDPATPEEVGKTIALAV